MRKRLLGGYAKTALAVLVALSMGIVGCGSSGGGTEAGTSPTDRSVAVKSVAFTGVQGPCTDGGAAIGIGIDKNGNGVLDLTEVTSTEYVCNGTDGTNGTNGTNGTDGLNGTNGVNGLDGANGKTALIKVSTEMNGANCATGGQKVEVGLDDDANMVLDALEVDQTAYVCNGTGSAVTFTAKGEACQICHGAGRSEDEVEAHKLPTIYNHDGVALLGRVDVSNIVVTPTLNGSVLQSLTIAFDAKAYDATNAQIGNNNLVTALNPTNSAQLGNLRFYLAKYNDTLKAWKTVVSGSRVPANLVLNSGNNFTYTFAAADLTAINVTDSATVGPFGFTTNGQYRAYIRFAPSNYYGAGNATQDFTMDGTTALVDRQIVTTAACEGCHGLIPNHGTSRPDAQACVICHNGPARMSLVNGQYVYDSTRPFSGFFAQDIWVHSLHADFGWPAITENGQAVFPAGEMTYPQDIKNCKTCHKGTAGESAYSTFKLTACKSCHQAATVFDATTGSHRNYTDSTATCFVCHDDATAPSIATAHATALSSPNAIAQVAGFRKVEYSITSAAVDASGNLTIVFSVSVDGTPIDLTGALPTNFTGGPSFMLAYALPQDGVTAPADWNNLGRASAQPATISLANIKRDGFTTPVAGWSLSNNAGVATAVIPAASAFPAGATMRAVALQGYFTDGMGTTDTADNIALHTVSVQKNVTGDTVRRKVVDPTKCGSCHEWFEAHGGNRVYETQVCAMCHVPNLTSSGRSVPLNTTVNTAGGVVPGGTDTLANIALFPEAPQSLKSLIHGAHSSELRQDPFEFVRFRSNTAFMFDLSEVEFPGILKNCETCHFAGTYGINQANLLNTTFVTTPGGVPTNTQVATARTTLPNATDLVATPVYSTCAICHDGAAQETHFNGNGGGVAPRSEINK